MNKILTVFGAALMLATTTQPAMAMTGVRLRTDAQIGSVVPELRVNRTNGEIAVRMADLRPRWYVVRVNVHGKTGDFFDIIEVLAVRDANGSILRFRVLESMTAGQTLNLSVWPMKDGELPLPCEKALFHACIQ